MPGNLTHGKKTNAAAEAATGTIGGAAAEDTAAKAEEAVTKLVSDIRSENEEVRTQAWLKAAHVGASAVGPLAELMAQPDIKVARAAKHGLWRLVRNVGCPGCGNEKNAVAAELIRLLGDNRRLPAVKREVLWMLSEIGGDESVRPIAAILSNPELREDARMALQRIPGKKSLVALEAALKNVPAGFRPNIAQSLRQRGAKVRGLPCVKLKPTKKTAVKPPTDGP